MKAILAVLLLCFIFPATSWAGPFGTEMGDKPEKFSGLVKVNDGKFKTDALPKSHPLF